MSDSTTSFLSRILVLAGLLFLSACASSYQITSVSTSSSHPSALSADGFDFPVAPPNAQGYSKSRGFRAGGHLGEDWITHQPGLQSFHSPVYSIGNGLVVLARDIHADWGNVVVIRHAWIERQQLHFTDSLYAHLDRIDVREGQQVRKGEQVGTIGTNHGMYPPHLHFEMHKDLSIGVNHAQGTRDLRSYWVPTDFINSHRHLGGGVARLPLPPANFLLPTAEHPWSFNRYFGKSKKRSKHQSIHPASNPSKSAKKSTASHSSSGNKISKKHKKHHHS